jgi:deoxycytidylate deaminase
MRNVSRPYPYIAPGRSIFYAPEGNPFIRQAKALRETIARLYPEAVVTASVIESEGVVIGAATNNPVHKTFCPRTALLSPSGEGYEWCPKYCHPDNHSEAGAIRRAQGQSRPTVGGALYLYGHWWLCKPCWDKIISAGIKDVFLVEGAAERFYQPVSGKGEPRRNVKVFLKGAVDQLPLDELLARVAILRVNNSRDADFVFSSNNVLSAGEFLLRLGEALEESGVYGTR